jgi:rubrerythrin
MEEFKSINDILDFAIVSEQEAVDFYTKLSKQATNEAMKEVFLQFAKEEMEIREIFLSLAQEEAKHKLRFEIEYDDYVLKEN